MAVWHDPHVYKLTPNAFVNIQPKFAGLYTSIYGKQKLRSG